MRLLLLFLLFQNLALAKGQPTKLIEIASDQFFKTRLGNLLIAKGQVRITDFENAKTQDFVSGVLAQDSLLSYSIIPAGTKITIGRSGSDFGAILNDVAEIRGVKFAAGDFYSSSYGSYVNSGYSYDSLTGVLAEDVKVGNFLLRAGEKTSFFCSIKSCLGSDEKFTKVNSATLNSSYKVFDPGFGNYTIPTGSRINLNYDQKLGTATFSEDTEVLGLPIAKNTGIRFANNRPIEVELSRDFYLDNDFSSIGFRKGSRLVMKHEYGTIYEGIVDENSFNVTNFKYFEIDTKLKVRTDEHGYIRMATAKSGGNIYGVEILANDRVLFKYDGSFHALVRYRANPNGLADGGVYVLDGDKKLVKLFDPHLVPNINYIIY